MAQGNPELGSLASTALKGPQSRARPAGCVCVEGVCVYTLLYALIQGASQANLFGLFSIPHVSHF